MARFPALPLWTDAYLGDTTHLTTLEHGAYLLLLIVAWRAKECRLPNDDKMLARYTKLTPKQWARIKPMIMSFFEEKDGFLYQGRLSDEHCFVKQHSQNQSRKARARWLKTNETDDAVAMPGQCRADPPTPTPRSKKDSKKASEELVSKNSKEEFSPNVPVNKVDNGDNSDAPPRSLLKASTHEQARKDAPGYDIYYLEERWRSSGFAAKATKPDAAFLGFVRKHVKENPL